jgi:hypothetical protein
LVLLSTSFTLVGAEKQATGSFTRCKRSQRHIGTIEYQAGLV